MTELERLAVLAPFGVWPVQAAGAEVVYQPAERFAWSGIHVDIVSLGLRRFERQWPRPFVNTLGEHLREHRVVGLRLVLDRVLRRTSRVPPLDFSRWLRRAPRAFRQRIADAQLVQLESPWAIEYARSLGKPLAFVVHNVECDLHRGELERRGWLARAQELEGRAWRECDVVFVAHEAERQRFVELYGEPQGSVHVLPFGVDIKRCGKATQEDRRRARQSLGIPADAVVGLFPGSAHAPNLSAAAFLREHAHGLAESGIFVLIAGSVTPREERFDGGLATGPLDDLADCFWAADFGLHPITEGSGMNLKVAQMLGLRLPVLATPFGARGYVATETEGLRRCELADFATSAAEWAKDPDTLRALGEAAHEHANAELDWDAIADKRLEALQCALR